jgi:uncharacterized protein YbjT (DUF2867 family)
MHEGPVRWDYKACGNGTLTRDMATAWVAGGSGLVGGALLRQLLQDEHFSKVVSAGRRTLALQHPKLTQVVVDFSSPPAFDALPPPDVAFACLGSTIKKAGSREAFRKVDHDAVFLFALAAKRKGSRVFVHVSALGADPRSRIFYNSVKGGIERDVARLGLPSVYAMRPSLLDGAREESRPAERLGLVMARALGPLLGKYRPTPVEALVRAMIASAKAAPPGAHVVDAGEIFKR